MKQLFFFSIVCIITPLIAMQDTYIPGLPNDIISTMIVPQLICDASSFELERDISTLSVVNKQYYSLINSDVIMSIVKKRLEELIGQQFEGNMLEPIEFKAIACDIPFYLHYSIKTTANLHAFLLKQYTKDEKKTGYPNETLLHCAVRCYAERCVQYLLRYAATDVNARNIGGETPLHYTALNFEPDIVHLLLAREDTDINAQDNESETALSQAVCLDSNDIALALLKYDTCNVNTKNYEGNTPLHKALGMGAEEIIRKLLEKGASINEPNNAGITPAQHAQQQFGPDYLSNLSN